jgi:hypothetical protein
MKMLLSKSDILAVPLKTKDIEIPDLGTVRIQELKGRQRDDFERSTAQGQKANNDFRKLRAKLVVASLVNEDGTLMFVESEIDTVNEKFSAKVLDLLFMEILTFNGMTQAASDEQEKN